MPAQQEPLPLRFRLRVSLRTWAVLLALTAAVPLLIFGWLTLNWMAHSHADTIARNQADTARVLSQWRGR